MEEASNKINKVILGNLQATVQNEPIGPRGMLSETRITAPVNQLEEPQAPNQNSYYEIMF